MRPSSVGVRRGLELPLLHLLLEDGPQPHVDLATAGGRPPRPAARARVLRVPLLDGDLGLRRRSARRDRRFAVARAPWRRRRTPAAAHPPQRYEAASRRRAASRPPQDRRNARRTAAKPPSPRAGSRRARRRGCPPPHARRCACRRACRLACLRACSCPWTTGRLQLAACYLLLTANSWPSTAPAPDHWPPMTDHLLMATYYWPPTTAPD